MMKGKNQQKQNKSNVCSFCGLSSVTFDPVLDMNICIMCGARETAVGWHAGDPKNGIVAEP
jgi:hypothetical protein